MDTTDKTFSSIIFHINRLFFYTRHKQEDQSNPFPYLSNYWIILLPDVRLDIMFCFPHQRTHGSYNSYFSFHWPIRFNLIGKKKYIYIDLHQFLIATPLTDLSIGLVLLEIPSQWLSIFYQKWNLIIKLSNGFIKDDHNGYRHELLKIWVKIYSILYFSANS